MAGDKDVNIPRSGIVINDDIKGAKFNGVEVTKGIKLNGTVVKEFATAPVQKANVVIFWSPTAYDNMRGLVMADWEENGYTYTSVESSSSSDFVQKLQNISRYVDWLEDTGNGVYFCVVDSSTDTKDVTFDVAQAIYSAVEDLALPCFCVDTKLSDEHLSGNYMYEFTSCKNPMQNGLLYIQWGIERVIQACANFLPAIPVAGDIGRVGMAALDTNAGIDRSEYREAMLEQIMQTWGDPGTVEGLHRWQDGGQFTADDPNAAEQILSDGNSSGDGLKLLLCYDPMWAAVAVNYYGSEGYLGGNIESNVAILCFDNNDRYVENWESWQQDVANGVENNYIYAYFKNEYDWIYPLNLISEAALSLNEGNEWDYTFDFNGGDLDNGTHSIVYHKPKVVFSALV